LLLNKDNRNSDLSQLYIDMICTETIHNNSTYFQRSAVFQPDCMAWVFLFLSKINGMSYSTISIARQGRFRIFKLTAVLIVFCCWLSGCATSKLGASGQKKIEGQTYVIIGASSGFVRGIAEELGKYHANVILAARRTELLEEVAAKIRASGGKALVVTTDISKPEEVQRLADTSTKVFGEVDVWINDVGVGAIGRFWEIPLEDYSRLIDVNLKGIIYGSYSAVKLFRAQGYGTLINLGSIDSETPLAYQATYSASKAGVRSLGQAMNQELRLTGEDDIIVVTIEPWAADTPWWGHAANYSGGTPRMWGMDDPQKVVNAVLRSSLRPRQELPVGWKATGSYFFHHLFPRFTEKMSANVAHRYQIETAPPAPPTKGTLYHPMSSGKGVDDGVRARMKKEKKERRFKKKTE
jgi:short-subunit dehydrogenase